MQGFTSLNEFYKQDLEKYREGPRDHLVASFWLFIPHSIIANPKLSRCDHEIYGEICALTHKYGYCYANNQHFIKNLRMSRKTVKRGLLKLEKEGYLKREVKRSKDGSRRKIWLVLKKCPRFRRR